MFVVLEDMEERVDWLKETFPDVEIAWFTGVTPFCAHLQSLADEGKKPTVILLDCDLGGPYYGSKDDEGLTGFDAAQRMPVTAPVVVWSLNEDMAPQMVAKVKERGSYGACWRPFYGEKGRLSVAGVLAQLVRRAEEG